MKPLFAKFDLELTSSNFHLTLLGSEGNKRKLIGYLATSQMNNHIDIETIAEGFDSNLDIGEIKILQNLINESDLTFNDYTKELDLPHFNYLYQIKRSSVFK